MSSDPQKIAPDLWVHTYAGVVGTDSVTRKRWQLTTSRTYIQLSYEEMCALRQWFLGPEAPATSAFVLADIHSREDG